MDKDYTVFDKSNALRLHFYFVCHHVGVADAKLRQDYVLSKFSRDYFQKKCPTLTGGTRQTTKKSSLVCYDCNSKNALQR